MCFWLPVQYSFMCAIFYMILISFGEIFVMPFSATFATKRGDGPRQGEYMGMYGLAYSFSNVLAPLVGTQMIARFGFDALWLLLVVFSAIAWLLLGKISEG
jgi:MFS family permease